MLGMDQDSGTSLAPLIATHWEGKILYDTYTPMYKQIVRMAVKSLYNPGAQYLTFVHVHILFWKQ